MERKVSIGQAATMSLIASQPHSLLLPRTASFVETAPQSYKIGHPCRVTFDVPLFSLPAPPLLCLLG